MLLFIYLEELAVSHPKLSSVCFGRWVLVRKGICIIGLAVKEDLKVLKKPSGHPFGVKVLPYEALP